MQRDYIIPFNKYDSHINENIDEGFQDILIGGLEMLGGGFVRTVKQKTIAWVLEYLKIKEKSVMSKLIQEIFEEISIKDYYGIITGKHANWDFFIPKIADGLVEFLQRSGFDGIAESIGIEVDGFLYNIIRESISDKIAKKKDFTEDIEKFLHSIFDDKSPRDAINVDEVINSMGSSARKETLNGIDKISKKVGTRKINTLGSQKKEASALSGYIKNLLKDGGGSFVKALTESKN